MHSKLSSHWRYLLVVPLALTAFLTPLLRYNDISPLASESLLTYSFLVVIGLLIGFFVILGGLPAQALFGGVFIVLFAFYQIDTMPKLPFGLRSMAVLLPLSALLALILYFLGKHLEQFLFIVFGVLWLGAFAQTPPLFTQNINQGTTLQANTSLPPYIHIILDEHIGIEGIPNYADPGQKFRMELKNKYIAQGFRVFGRAYSRYFRTKDSVSSLVDFRPRDEPYKSRYNKKGMLTPNVLFEKLTEQGYIINTFEPEADPYCDKEAGYKLGKCISYRTDKIHPESAPVTILYALLERIKVVNRINDIADGLGLPRFIIQPTPIPIDIGAFNKHIDFLSEGKRGNAYFVHLILPHFHWILDEECSYRKGSGFFDGYDSLNFKSSPIWFRATGGNFDEGYKNFTERLQDYSSDQDVVYRAYLKQVKCSQKIIDNLLSTLNSNPAAKDSTIVIHGDHGSRITSIYPFIKFADQLTEEEYIQSFSTFFVVRGPNHIPKYDRRPIALDELMRSVVFDMKPLPDIGESKFVYLSDLERQVYKRYPLPPFANGQPAPTW